MPGFKFKIQIFISTTLSVHIIMTITIGKHYSMNKYIIMYSANVLTAISYIAKQYTKPMVEPFIRIYEKNRLYIILLYTLNRATV